MTWGSGDKSVPSNSHERTSRISNTRRTRGRKGVAEVPTFTAEFSKGGTMHFVSTWKADYPGSRTRWFELALCELQSL